MDLIDITASFKFNSLLVNSQAFSSLLDLLHKERKNPKNKLVFIDCFHSFGQVISGWAFQAVPLLIKNGVFNEEEILMEILTRLKGNRDSQLLLLQGFFKLPSCCSLKTVFQILQIDISLSYIVARSIIQKADDSLYPCLLALYSCSDVSLDTKVLILNFFIDGHTKEIDFSDPFKVVNECQKNPKILLNKNFPNSYVLLPYMISLTKVLSDMEKSLPGLQSDTIPKAKAIMLSGMKANLDHINETPSWNKIFFLKKVIDDNPNGYLKLWKKQMDAIKSKSFELEDLLFAASFLPFAETRLVTETMNKIVLRTPTLANIALNFYILVLTKPHCNIDKPVLLKSIKEIACTKYVIDPVINYLMLLTEKTGDIVPLRFISELVLKNQSLVDKVLPLVKIQDIDDEDKIQERINLLKNMLLVSSRTDRIYPILENLLTKNDPILGYAIEALVEVSDEEESFHFRAMHKLLSKQVREKGNTDALAKYCSFLSLCRKLDTETQQDYRHECIKELWRLTTYDSSHSEKENDNVRRAAWEAIASLDQEELFAVLSLDSKSLMSLVSNMRETEMLGFEKFLKKIIQDEVENVPRPVYTKRYTFSDPILSLSENWFEALSRSNKESPWLWKSTLGLSPYLVSSCPPERSKTMCLKLLRRLLSEVPQPRKYGVNDLVNAFASWRMLMKESIVLLAKEGDTSLISARDHITDECSKALRQTELCLSNVLFVITALILEITDAMKEMISVQRKETEVAMKPWIGGACHFIFPLCDPSETNFVGLMNPIFQTCVKPTEFSRDVARFCDWMLSSYALGPRYYEDISYSVKNRYDPFTPDNPITAQYIKLVSGSRNFTGSRSSLYSLGAALGISPLRLSLLSEFADDKDSIRSLESSLSEERTPESMTLILKNISNLSVAERYKSRNAVKKVIEREWSNSDSFKQSIYEALADYCRITWLQSSESLPMNYDHLSEKSILKDVISEFMIRRFPSFSFVSFIHILSSIRRSDQRTLPPLNWAPLLEEIMYERNVGDAALDLCIQEKCKMVVYKLSDRILRDKIIRPSTILVFMRDLPFVLSCLNAELIPTLLDKLLELVTSQHAQSDDILSVITGCRENSIVHDYIKNRLPNLEPFDSESVLDSVVMQLQMDGQFEGEISLFFDFYVLCGGHELKFPHLFQIYEATQYNSICLRILGFKVHAMDVKDNIQSFIVLAGYQSYENSRGNYKDEAFDFFLVLVCSISTQLPLFWTGREDIKKIIYSRWRYYWEEGVLPLTTTKLALVLQRFLLNNLVSHSNEKKKDIMREMLYSLFPIANTSVGDMLKFDDTERHLLFNSESAHRIHKAYMEKIERKSVF